MIVREKEPLSPLTKGLIVKHDDQPFFVFSKEIDSRGKAVDSRGKYG